MLKLHLLVLATHLLTNIGNDNYDMLKMTMTRIRNDYLKDDKNGANLRLPRVLVQLEERPENAQWLQFCNE